MKPADATRVLIEPHFLPCLEYFCAIQEFERVQLEASENYVKQSYRNRCYINTSQGRQMMIVPLTGRHGKVAFRDVQIDPGAKWRNNSWRTICSAYAKAPFFEHYSDELHDVFFSDCRFLFDLNVAGLSFCLRNLGMDKSVESTTTFEKQSPSGVYDLRSQIECKRGETESRFYQPQPYVQVFGSGFASNLSVIDLLFCEGPNSVRVLRNSGRAI